LFPFSRMNVGLKFKRDFTISKVLLLIFIYSPESVNVPYEMKQNIASDLGLDWFSSVFVETPRRT
jgi:hypothetical protein